MFSMLGLALSASATERPEAGRWDVRTFGAKADGVHDDLPAIQAAIDAAGDAGGGVVWLPPSEKGYLIGGSIRMNRDYVQLKGEASLIKLADGAGRLEKAGGIVHIIHIAGNAEDPVEHVSIEGLVIDANYWGQIGDTVAWQQAAKIAGIPRGVRMDYAEHVRVANVKIERPFVGLTFGRGCHHGTVEDVHVREFHHDGFGVSPGYVDAGATHIVFRRCIVSDSYDGRDGGPIGTRVKGFEIEEGAHHVTLIDCVVRDTSAYGYTIRPHAPRGDFATSDIKLIRCKYLNAGKTEAPASGFFIKGYGYGPVTRRVTLIDCEAPDDSMTIVMAPQDGVVRGGKFGMLTLGFYPDLDDPHHLPHGPHGDEAFLLPIINAEVTGIEVSGETRINLSKGMYKGRAYEPELVIKDSEFKGDLLVVGDEDRLNELDFKVGGTINKVETETFFANLGRGIDRDAEPPSLVVPWNKDAPVIDGKGHDTIYSKPQKLTWGWKAPNRLQPINTVFQAVATEKGLAVLLATDDPYVGRVRADADDDKDAMWFDDNFELLIRRPGDEHYYQWIVNTKGKMFDAQPHGIWERYDSGAEAACTRFKRGYTIELLIPWEAVGGMPKEGEAWAANVIHHRSTTGRRWLWSWKYDDYKYFDDSDKFGRFVFEKVGP